MSIEDRLGNKAEAWIAENAGDKFIGKIVSLYELSGDYGPYPAVEFQEKGTGKYYVWHAFDTVAKNELSKLSPAVGDEIGAFYLGKKLKKGAPAGSTKSDDSFKDWQVIIEKATTPIDAPQWDTAAVMSDANSYPTGLPQGQAPSFDDEEVEPF